LPQRPDGPDVGPRPGPDRPGPGVLPGLEGQGGAVPLAPGHQGGLPGLGGGGRRLVEGPFELAPEALAQGDQVTPLVLEGLEAESEGPGLVGLDDGPQLALDLGLVLALASEQAGDGVVRGLDLVDVAQPCGDLAGGQPEAGLLTHGAVEGLGDSGGCHLSRSVAVCRGRGGARGALGLCLRHELFCSFVEGCGRV